MKSVKISSTYFDASKPNHNRQVISHNCFKDFPQTVPVFADWDDNSTPIGICTVNYDCNDDTLTAVANVVISDELFDTINSSSDLFANVLLLGDTPAIESNIFSNISIKHNVLDTTQAAYKVTTTIEQDD